VLQHYLVKCQNENATLLSNAITALPDFNPADAGLIYSITFFYSQLILICCMDASTGGAGWASAHPGKIRVGMAHPGNFSRGLKTFWQ